MPNIVTLYKHFNDMPADEQLALIEAIRTQRSLVQQEKTKERTPRKPRVTTTKAKSTTPSISKAALSTVTPEEIELLRKLGLI
jgi:hypothetical protein